MNTTQARSKSLAAAIFILVSAMSLSAQPFQSGKPWYAAGLEKLGFTLYDKPVAVGDFQVMTMDGNLEKFSQQRGKIVILNFWATWCPPCREEMPALDTLWKKNKDKPFVIMGVSTGEPSQTVKAFIAKAGYKYPIYLDQGGELGAAFGAQSIPLTYIFNKNGQVIARKVGGAPYDSAEAIALFAQLATK